MIVSRLNEYGKLMYGSGLANSLAYMMSGFRGWELHGLVMTHPDHAIGVEVDRQGATTNAVYMCALYGNRDCMTVESEEFVKECKQIEDGKTAIILFRGIDNTSYMRRMRPDEYDRMVIREYIACADDLFYNS